MLLGGQGMAQLLVTHGVARLPGKLSWLSCVAPLMLMQQVERPLSIPWRFSVTMVVGTFCHARSSIPC